MTKREVAVLACRILAIVAFLNVIQSRSPLSVLLYQALNPDKFSSIIPILGYFPLPIWLALLYLSPLVLLLIVAFFLWT